MGQGSLIEEELSRSLIGAFYEVYNELGYGHSESVHAKGLYRELKSRGHSVACEKSFSIDYKGEFLCRERLDMVVDDKLIIEIKSTEVLPPTAVRQLQNYLRCTEFEIGLLLHFGPEPRFYRRFLPNSQKKIKADKNKTQKNTALSDVERI
ncbi:MAG: GxxExxY protein [Gemmatimonadales bacterium]